MDRDERGRLRAVFTTRFEGDEGDMIGSVDGLPIPPVYGATREQIEARIARMIEVRREEYPMRIVRHVPALLDALDAADRAAELAQGTIAALRDRLAEVERERDALCAAAELACIEPRDGCDCAGCLTARARGGE